MNKFERSGDAYLANFPELPEDLPPGTTLEVLVHEEGDRDNLELEKFLGKEIDSLGQDWFQDKGKIPVHLELRHDGQLLWIATHRGPTFRLRGYNDWVIYSQVSTG